MCGNVKHDEHGNHIEEVTPTPLPVEAPIDVTKEFEKVTTSVEVPAEADA